MCRGVSLETHVAVFIKAVIVLSSWIFGYFALKHLPLTITGPIKATQPVVTLVGAMLVFGERLNLYQWIGVILSIASFYLLSSSGKKEGIRFTHNKWIFFTVLSILTGAASGLYDKHLMGSLDVMTVQVWFNVYQCLMMLPITCFFGIRAGKARHLLSGTGTLSLYPSSSAWRTGFTFMP